MPLQQDTSQHSARPAAKSSLMLEIKPWEADTDTVALEAAVREVGLEGLLWGQSRLEEIGYGVKKLVINAVVEDQVSIDDLVEAITESGEEYVQSVDIVAFNKL